MRREAEPGYIGFNPSVKYRTPTYYRICEIVDEMEIRRTTAFCYYNMDIVGLGFETKEQAMIFRLKLG